MKPDSASCYYVGLGASLHDPAVAILDPTGRPLFAEASERYLQNKRAYQTTADDLIRVPELVREFCPHGAHIVVAVSWSADMARTLNAAAFGAFAEECDRPAEDPRIQNELSWPMPGPELMLIGLRNSLSQAGLNLRASGRISSPVNIRRYDHHRSHAALASYTSPFAECSVAVIDGYGEKRSTAFFRYGGGTLTSLPNQPWDSPVEIEQSISLGHFYARLCALCGFDPVVGEEWKVMGLASYGEIDEHIYRLMKPLIGVEGLTLCTTCPNDEAVARLEELRTLAQRHKTPREAADLACTGQRVFEEIMTRLLLNLHLAAPSENLALCGGCALNSSCNGHILERTPFRRLHVPSAPADDGCALGAALLAFMDDHPNVKAHREIGSPYLGSCVRPGTLANLETFSGLSHLRRNLPALIDEVVDLLCDGRIVGWMRGQAEFGPRALGHRSILADPRSPDVKDRLNARVKFREEFRPFAPSVLDEHGADYFENYQTSRYMERTLRFKQEKAKLVPAVVHVDGTGRVQSVAREWDAVFYDLIHAFFKRTGVPLILNTSLNIMGKPIAHSVEDALGLFWTTGLDALVIEDILLCKVRTK